MTPRKPLTPKQRVDEAILTAAVMEILSNPPGFEFTADTIFAKIKDRLPKARLSTLVQRKMGVFMRRCKNLGLIHQTGKAVKSSRENHDGSLIHVWAVGKIPNGALAQE
jgi:hypothetical protein